MLSTNVHPVPSQGNLFFEGHPFPPEVWGHLTSMLSLCCSHGQDLGCFLETQEQSISFLHMGPQICCNVHQTAVGSPSATCHVRFRLQMQSRFYRFFQIWSHPTYSWHSRMMPKVMHPTHLYLSLWVRLGMLLIYSWCFNLSLFCMCLIGISKFLLKTYAANL
jgi:hypothetical protein